MSNTDFLALRRFTDFVTNAPAHGPLGGGELLALIQNSLTKNITVSELGGAITAVRILTIEAVYQMLSSDQFVGVNKTVGAPTSILLPASPSVGKVYIVADMKGDADVNNITISGGTMDGGATVWYINIPLQVVGLEWTGVYWKIGV